MLQRNITANYNTYWNSPLCFDKVRNFPLHISYPNAPLQIETKIHAATSVMLSTTIHTYLTNVSNIKPDKLFVSCSGSRQLPLGTLTLNINSSYIESSITQSLWWVIILFHIHKVRISSLSSWFLLIRALLAHVTSLHGVNTDSIKD